MLPAIYKTYAGHLRKYSKLIAIALLIICALIFNVVHGNQDEIVVDTSGTEQEYSESEEVASAEGYVDISGEVEHPGVYKIDGHTRLYQVIDKAGGVTDNADLNQINQAEILEDGAKIIIPEIGRNNTVSDGESGGGANTGQVNINNADKDQLMTLDGIGEVIAGRIIEYRESSRFESIEDIMNVNGIGEATYNKIKASITI